MRFSRWQSNALYPRSIGAGQAADREFDAAAGEFTPRFDFRHIGRFRKLREIGGRFDPRLAALERIGLAPPSAFAGRRLRPRPFGETARDVRWCFLFSVHFGSALAAKNGKGP